MYRMNKLARYISLLSILIFGGCFRTQPRQEALQSEIVFLHPITYPGETLHTIALWYTGSANNWKQIRNYNANVKLSELPLKSIIRIPASLMVTQQLLPKDFVDAHKVRRKPQKKTSSASPSGSTVNSEEGVEDEGSREESELTDPQDEIIDKLIEPDTEEQSP